MRAYSTAELQRQSAQNYRKYLVDLSKKNPEQAKREARAELIKMGLLNSDGSKKEIIVSWE